MESTKPHPDRPALALAAILLVIAVVTAWDASRLPAAVYGMGPRAVPTLIACGLGLLAIANAVLAWRGDFPAREDSDPRAIVLILGGLAALIAIISFGGGFIVATTVLFAAVATAFGRRAFLVDAGIGLALAVAVYLMFDKLLTLSLPQGPLERLL